MYLESNVPAGKSESIAWASKEADLAKAICDRVEELDNIDPKGKGKDVLSKDTSTKAGASLSEDSNNYSEPKGKGKEKDTSPYYPEKYYNSSNSDDSDVD